MIQAPVLTTQVSSFNMEVARSTVDYVAELGFFFKFCHGRPTILPDRSRSDDYRCMLITIFHAFRTILVQTYELRDVVHSVSIISSGKSNFIFSILIFPWFPIIFYKEIPVFPYLISTVLTYYLLNKSLRLQKCISVTSALIRSHTVHIQQHSWPVFIQFCIRVCTFQ